MYYCANAKVIRYVTIYIVVSLLLVTIGCDCIAIQLVVVSSLDILHEMFLNVYT